MGREQQLREIAALNRLHGLEDAASSTETLYRVLKTREALRGAPADADTVYRVMRSAADVGRFPGDAALFYQYYQRMSCFDEDTILRFVADCADRGAAPRELTALFADRLTADVRTVLMAECEQYGPPLLELVRAHPQIRFVLTCRHSLRREILASVYRSCENVSLIDGDIYSYGFTDERFDRIAAVPAFGGRTLVEGEDFISREPDLVALQNLLYHLNLDGELFIVLPAKITFGGGSAASLRSYIEQNYRIKEIDALPPGLFMPHTAIRTYLFTFSTGETEDVVVRQYDMPSRRGGPQLILRDEALLFSDELIGLGGWNIEMALSEEDDDVRTFLASPVKKLRLEETATIFRGKAVSSRPEGGNIAVINISDISEAGIDYSGLDFIAEEEHKVARYALEEGDVLVTSRGTTVKVAVFVKQPVTCIPSANLNVIRPKGNLRGAYLKLFLESPAGGKLLKGLQRGAQGVNINFRDLYGLEVPAPPLAAQDALIAEYDAGQALYQAAVAAAEEAWARIQADIREKLY